MLTLTIFVGFIALNSKRQPSRAILQTYETAWFWPEGPGGTTGYTINGIKLGASLETLRRGLPPQYQLENVSDNEFWLSDTSTRTDSTVNLQTDRDGKIVRIQAIGKSSLEKDGKVIVRRLDPIDSLRAIFGEAVEPPNLMIDLPKEQGQLVVNVGDVVSSFRLQRGEEEPHNP